MCFCCFNHSVFEPPLHSDPIANVFCLILFYGQSSSPLISLYSLYYSLFYSPSSCASLSLSSIPKSSRDLSLLFAFLSGLLSLFSTFFSRSLYSLPSSVNSQSLFSTSISRFATLSSVSLCVLSLQILF